MKSYLRFILSVALIAGVYIVLATFIMNAELVWDTLVEAYPVTYKVNLLVALLEGMFTAMSGFGLIMLFLTAFFTGINLTLIAQKIMFLKLSSRLQVTTGGSSFLGFIGSGCAACGLPVLSLLGLSGSIIYLPFRGSEISVIALSLLIISFYFLMKSARQPNVCKVK